MYLLFVSNFEHFVPLLGSIKVPGGNILTSFNVISLIVRYPADEALQVMKSKLNLEHTVPRWLCTTDIVDLLEVCEKYIFFMEDRFISREKASLWAHLWAHLFLRLSAKFLWNILRT
jgi:hypothetical protein